ncbi:hypothetical protein ACRARE_22430 [Pseudooceanicola sp. 200-1SW]
MKSFLMGAALFLASCAPPPELVNPEKASDLQVLAALHDLVARGRHSGGLDYDHVAFDEIDKRGLLSLAEVARVRISRVEEGYSLAHVIASWGMPTHLQYINEYQVLYYYRNVGMLFKRQMIVIRNQRVAGQVQLVKLNGRYRWSGKGVIPTAAWKLGAPQAATFMAPVAPRGVLTCNGASNPPCSTLRVARGVTSQIYTPPKTLPTMNPYANTGSRSHSSSASPVLSGFK